MAEALAAAHMGRTLRFHKNGLKLEVLVGFWNIFQTKMHPNHNGQDLAVEIKKTPFWKVACPPPWMRDTASLGMVLGHYLTTFAAYWYLFEKAFNH